MPVTVSVRSTPDAFAAEDSPGKKPAEAPSLTFEGSRIVIGRGSGSDVRLPDPSVSLRHATIRSSGADYAIVDEGSTNGTVVGGIRLLPQTPRIVRTGDLVRVGRVWLEITIGQRAATPDLGMATRDLALALVRQAMDAFGQDTAPRVRVAEGPDLGLELRLVEEGRAYVLGRAEQCDMPLADPDASREHATVVRRGTTILLRDLDSRNGVILGEHRLEPGRDAIWRPPTMVRLGLTVLAVDEPVGVALAELEAAEDEAIADQDLPAAPPASEEVVAKEPTPEPSPAVPAEFTVESALGASPALHDDAPVAKAKRSWTVTDLFVVALAIAVIGASVAGLVWVLR